MPLWHPADPLGLAPVRKVMLGAAVFIALIGLSRTLGAGDLYGPFAWSAGLLVAVALFADPLARAFRRRRTP